APAERAIRAFDAQIVLLVYLILKLAFAANCENVVLHSNVQILRIYIRQVRLNDQFIFRLVDVNGRSPQGQVRLLARTSYAIAKHAIDLFLQGRSPTERLLPSIHCSHFYPPQLNVSVLAQGAISDNSCQLRLPSGSVYT